MLESVRELLKKCREEDRIYIYGAGQNASCTWHFLNKHMIEVDGFLVSDMSVNPLTFLGLGVCAADAFSEKGNYIILVPAYTRSRTYREIYDFLADRGICNVYFFTSDLMAYIRSDMWTRQKREVELEQARPVFNVPPYHMAEDVPVEPAYHIFAMEGADGTQYRWRFQTASVKKQGLVAITDAFPGMSAIEEFEKQYGPYHAVPSGGTVLCGGKGRKTDCAIYMARSHVDSSQVRADFPSFIIPLQVGAALTDQDICDLKDNVGENISERNGNYSECTALYWMWKNAPKTDYIGLCHYRRHLHIDEEGIAGLEAGGMDVLVTAPTFVNETVYAFFAELVPETDLRLMERCIQAECPAYARAAREFLSGRFYPPCNLFIMKYSLFMEYGDFLFAVAFAIEERYRELGYLRHDRYMGFLVECLLGIFLMKNRERLTIAYTDMKFYE